MKYPSKLKGESYVMPPDIFDRQGVASKWDAGRIILAGQEAQFQFVDTNLVELSDNEDVRLYVTTSDGYKASDIITDRKSMFTSRFMQSAKDWHNVEITFAFNYAGGNDQGSIIIGARGGFQENPCEGFAYRAILNLTPTSGQITRQEYYPSGNIPIRDFVTSKMGTTLKNRITALKLVIYDIDANQQPTVDNTKSVAVKIEFFGKLESGQFKKITEAMDDGSRGTLAVCGGSAGNAALWGGPLIFIQWGNGAQIQIRSLTVREIDPTKDFTSIPSSNTIPSGSNTLPPPSSSNNESANDDYGVKKIMQSKSGADHWYPDPKAVTSDDRFDANGANIKNNGDGTYHVTGKSRMLIYATKVANQKGESYVFSTYDFSELQKRGFWEDSKDFRDTEVTMYINCKTLTGSADEFSIVCRSVRHEETDHNGCGGSSYHGSLRFTDGSARLIKEPRHVDYTDYLTSDKKLGNIIGKKIGLKFICYNKSSTSVQNEVWLDKNADNNWTKYIEFLDVGEWSQGSAQGMSPCGAVTKGAAITWGSTKIVFKDNGLDITFSKLSVRHITGKTMAELPTTPGGGGTGQVSRVFSKYIMLWDMILDSSGVTCQGFTGSPPPSTYTEVTDLTVDTVTNDKQIAGTFSAEQDRDRVGWYCNATDAKLAGLKPRRIKVKLKKTNNTLTGNVELKVLDASNNTKVSYGTTSADALGTSYALVTFTNDNAPSSISQGIQKDWKIAVEYTSGDSTHYVSVGVNYNNPVDSTKTCEYQHEKEPGPGYFDVKHTDRDVCGSIWL